MPSTQNYRSRASHVRQAARSHLKELRQQRMSKRGHQPQAAAAEPPANADLGLPDPIETTQEARPHLAAIEAPEERMSVDDHTRDVETPSETAHDDAEESDALHDQAIENAAMTEMENDLPGTESPQHALEDDADVSASADTPEPSGAKEEMSDVPSALASPMTEQLECAPEGDLAALPGAGPGLIWMLNQCSITSLNDLAAADPARLSQDLGVVGQILDVKKWLEFAQNAKRQT